MSRRPRAAASAQRATAASPLPAVRRGDRAPTLLLAVMLLAAAIGEPLAQQTVLKASKRIQGDFTGDGRLEAAVLYQSEAEGHVTVFRRVEGHSEQLWKSDPAAFNDIEARDLTGDGKDELLFYLLQGEGRLKLRVFTFDRRTFHSIFEETVSSPGDLEVVEGDVPTLRLKPLTAGAPPLPERLYEFKEGRFEPVTPAQQKERKTLLTFQPVETSPFETIRAVSTSGGGRLVCLRGRRPADDAEGAFLLSVPSRELYLLRPRGGETIRACHIAPTANRLVVELCKGECASAVVAFPDGVELARFRAARPPQWSRDGKYLLYEEPKNGLVSVYLMETDGYAPTYLFDAEAAFLSDDGRTVAFEAGAPSESAQPSLLLFEWTTGKQRRLATTEDPKAPKASPWDQTLFYRTDQMLLRLDLQNGEEELLFSRFATFNGKPFTVVDFHPSYKDQAVYLLESRGGATNVLWRLDLDDYELRYLGAGVVAFAETHRGELYLSDGKGLYLWESVGGGGEPRNVFQPSLPSPFVKELDPGYAVQVAARRDFRTLISLVKKLNQLEPDLSVPRTVLPAIVSGEIWYRTRVGNFASQQKARQYAGRLEKHGFDVWIVQLNP